MAIPDCSFQYLWPGGNCSGVLYTGMCVLDSATNRSMCECNGVVKSIGDFNFDPVDCDQIQPLYLACYLLLLVHSSPVFIYLSREIYEFKMRDEFNSSVLLILCTMGLSSGSASVLAIVKIVCQERVLVGRDPGVTLLNIVVAASYWASCILWAKKMHDTVVANARTGLLRVKVPALPLWILLALTVVTYPLAWTLCVVDNGKHVRP